MNISLPIPRLETERLILRGYVQGDFEPLADFFASDYSTGFGGPDTRENAWRWMASNLGHWVLHGYGYWHIERKDTGAHCGLVGLWNPEGWPEPELGWVIYEPHARQGFAKEAALCARDYAYDTLGWTTLTSNIVPGNTASQALAESLGAVYERTYINPTMGEDRLFRHPGPEART